MGCFQPLDLVRDVRQARSAKEVAAFFADLSLLPPQDRQAVLQALQDEVVAEFRSARFFAPDVAELRALVGLAETKGDGLVAAFADVVRRNSLDADPQDWAMHAALVCGIARGLGDAADACVRAFAQAVDAQPPSARGGAVCRLSVRLRVEEQLRAPR